MLRLWLIHRLIDSAITKIGENLIANFVCEHKDINIGDRFTVIKCYTDCGYWTMYGAEINSMYYDDLGVSYTIVCKTLQYYDISTKRWHESFNATFEIFGEEGTNIEFFK